MSQHSVTNEKDVVLSLWRKELSRIREGLDC